MVFLSSVFAADDTDDLDLPLFSDPGAETGVTSIPTRNNTVSVFGFVFLEFIQIFQPFRVSDIPRRFTLFFVAFGRREKEAIGSGSLNISPFWAFFLE